MTSKRYLPSNGPLSLADLMRLELAVEAGETMHPGDALRVLEDLKDRVEASEPRRSWEASYTARTVATLKHPRRV